MLFEDFLKSFGCPGEKKGKKREGKGMVSVGQSAW